jgi:hypothetical protein
MSKLMEKTNWNNEYYIKQVRIAYDSTILIQLGHCYNAWPYYAPV